MWRRLRRRSRRRSLGRGKTPLSPPPSSCPHPRASFAAAAPWPSMAHGRPSRNPSPPLALSFPSRLRLSADAPAHAPSYSLCRTILGAAAAATTTSSREAASRARSAWTTSGATTRSRSGASLWRRRGRRWTMSSSSSFKSEDGGRGGRGCGSSIKEAGEGESGVAGGGVRAGCPLWLCACSGGLLTDSATQSSGPLFA